MKKLTSLVLIITVFITTICMSTSLVSAYDGNAEYNQIIKDYIGAYEMCLEQNQGNAPSDAEKVIKAFPSVNMEYIMSAIIPPAMRSDEITKKPKYFLKDVDGNNQQELFIGTEDGNYGNQHLYGVFTFYDGEVIDLMGNDIGYRKIVYLLSDNTLWEETSGGWQSFSGKVWSLTTNFFGCTLEEEVKTECDDIWYYNYTQVSKERANQIIQEKRNKILYIDWEELYNFDNEIKVVLNGNEIEFDQSPIMQNDRVLVPIRAIFEAMGYTVSWDELTQTATAIKHNDKITVQINNNVISYTVNGRSGNYTCDVVPQIISGRTLVPVRAIAESAGCDVWWDNTTETVYIRR